ncbi:protein of unknown function [Candidatus Hydrogenisulfobacillus filiaventi]|uniref:Uncharacterized protein n=1 Tax=Candidatus Hydrogenisulfobacillus filiaventi TaxID=2707344 RepID=A0A6F8ZGQ7_9FIRM|nr:hypothetical protein [Bacillota bacterium]CAB1128940.1 protein of unknown function [Candidatus Hydrogenisulfobacillus filiaventi]
MERREEQPRIVTPAGGRPVAVTYFYVVLPRGALPPSGGRRSPARPVLPDPHQFSDEVLAFFRRAVSVGEQPLPVERLPSSPLPVQWGPLEVWRFRLARGWEWDAVVVRAAFEGPEPGLEGLLRFNAEFRQALWAVLAEDLTVRPPGIAYCKVLSFAAVDARQGEGWTRRLGPYTVADWFDAGRRFKRHPATADMRENGAGSFLNPPPTDRVFHQWASTRYGFTPAGEFILALSHNGGVEVPQVTRPGNTLTWVGARYLPMVLLAEVQRQVLLQISELTGRNRRSRHFWHGFWRWLQGTSEFAHLFRQFRRGMWFYSLSRDIQDERLWLEAKASRRLDELFDRIQQQVLEDDRDSLNQRLYVLAAVVLLATLLGLPGVRAFLAARLGG